MEANDYSMFYRTMVRKVGATELTFKRDLYNKINWNNRLIGIKGPKGVGKTTLVLQHIKESFDDPSKVLFASLDNLWFATNSIQDLVEYHYSHGGTHIFLDEVHKYKKWQIAIKNFYDDYPDLHIVYTGSSMLQLDTAKADLSRRQRVYDLPGMSFREFLEYENLIKLPVFSFEDIIKNHVKIASEITSDIKILPAFEKYLRCGYYPFYKEDLEGFSLRLQEVARQVIEQDLPTVLDVEYGTIEKAKKLLMILSVQVPFVPNMKDLYDEIETNREQGLKILNALEAGGLLFLLKSKLKAVKHMSSPDKIYLDNPNLMYAFSEDANIGNIRETFFANQLSKAHTISPPSHGDFLVDSKYIFEVGGAKKSFEQIKDLPDSYLAVDNIELGHGARIPLWMFGLMY